MPSSNAAVFSVASFRRMPNRRKGSASPRNPLPIAAIASSGLELLNEARSEARPEKPVANLARFVPDNPAAFPKVPKVPAASRTACFDCPILSLALQTAPFR
jgi:hypothetical protein